MYCRNVLFPALMFPSTQNVSGRGSCRRPAPPPPPLPPPSAPEPASESDWLSKLWGGCRSEWRCMRSETMLATWVLFLMPTTSWRDRVFMV
jgi:hypothetical protein